MTPTQNDEEYKKQVDMIISWLMESPKEYHHINSAKIRLYDVVQYFSQQKLEAVKREYWEAGRSSVVTNSPQPKWMRALQYCRTFEEYEQSKQAQGGE